MNDAFGKQICVDQLLVFVNGRYGYKHNHLSLGIVTKVNQKTLRVFTLEYDYFNDAIGKEILLRHPSNLSSNIIALDTFQIHAMDLEEKHNKLLEAYHGARCR